MSWWDSISGALLDAGKWVGRNSDWLGPTMEAGGSYYFSQRQQRARQNQMREYQNALNAQGQAEPQIIPGLEEGAAAEAIAALEEQYAAAMEMLAPFVKTAKRVLPKMERTYDEGLTHLGSLGKFTMTPDMFAKTQQSIPAYSVPLLIPNSLRGGKNG